MTNRTAFLPQLGIAEVDPRVATELSALPALLRETDLILDALIGYSLRIALDLPSGLDGDVGEPCDPTLRAAATLTLARPKTGLLEAGMPSLDPSVIHVVAAHLGSERSARTVQSPIEDLISTS